MLVLALAISGSATTFSSRGVTKIDGTVPAVYYSLKFENCGGYILRVTGVGVKTDAGGARLYPDSTTGAIAAVTVPDEDTVACGLGTTGFYSVTEYFRDANGAWRKGASNNYDLGAAYCPANACVLEDLTPKALVEAIDPAELPFDLTINLKNPAVMDSGEFCFDVTKRLLLTQMSCDVPIGSGLVNLEIKESPQGGGAMALSTPLACYQAVDCVLGTGCATAFAARLIQSGGRGCLTIADIQGAPTVLHVHVSGSRK